MCLCVYQIVFLEWTQQCDPLCTPDSNVEKAWMSIRKRIFEGLQIPLVEMDLQNNHAENGTKHNLN